MPGPNLLLYLLGPRFLTGCGLSRDYALHSQSGEPDPSEHLRFVKRYSDSLVELFAGEDSPCSYHWIEDEDERRQYVRSRWCKMLDPSNPIDRAKAESCLDEIEARLADGYGSECEALDYDCALCRLEQVPGGKRDACPQPSDNDDGEIEIDTGDTGDTGWYGGQGRDLLTVLLHPRFARRRTR